MGSRNRPAAVADPRAGLSPASQLRVSLQRHQKLGVAFDAAWRLAWNRILWPHGPVARGEWQAIMSVQREHWRRAYDGLPAQQRTIEAPAKLHAA